MTRDTRRIVTGHDENGKAIAIADGTTPNVFRPDHRPGVQINNIWQVSESPAHLMSQEETMEGRIALEPPPNGSVCRVIEFPPEKDWIGNIDRETAHASFTQFGAAHAADTSENPPHPLMHRTETIDYAICLEGEIWARARRFRGAHESGRCLRAARHQPRLVEPLGRAVLHLLRADRRNLRRLGLASRLMFHVKHMSALLTYVSHEENALSGKMRVPRNIISRSAPFSVPRGRKASIRGRRGARSMRPPTVRRDARVKRPR